MLFPHSFASRLLRVLARQVDEPIRPLRGSLLQASFSLARLFSALVAQIPVLHLMTQRVKEASQSNGLAVLGSFILERVFDIDQEFEAEAGLCFTGLCCT